MANSNNLNTKNFTWKVDNVLSLPQPTGKYRQSEIFSSIGPAGQQVKWCLRLFPRGDDSKAKNFISIYLHLLDANGSDEIRANCKLSIVNERGTKLNKQETSFCLHTLRNDPEYKDFGAEYNGWGFNKFIGRDKLATDSNYIVHGHQLILDCQIEIKKDKQLIENRAEKRRLTTKIAELEQKLKDEAKEKDELKQNLKKEIKEKNEIKREKEKIQEKYEKLVKVREDCKKLLEDSAIDEEVPNFVAPIKNETTEEVSEFSKKMRFSTDE